MMNAKLPLERKLQALQTRMKAAEAEEKAKAGSNSVQQTTPR